MADVPHRPQVGHGRWSVPGDPAAGDGGPRGNAERGLCVLFATHNGARTLTRMLAAVGRLRAPQRPWRIVAVDNASTDESVAILRAAQGVLPLEVVQCPTPGKMPALILGSKIVTGDLVVFTDDDVEPDPDWLLAYEAAADQHPEAGLFGGSITPMPIDPLSPWFEASLGQRAELFAQTELGDGPVEDACAHIFGPNFMLRRPHLDLLERVGATIGPTFADGRSRRFPMGEDTLLVSLAQQDGVLARGVAGAGVGHMVRAYQTELGFMLDRAVRHGRGWAIRYAGAGRPSLRRRVKLAAIGLCGSVSLARAAAPRGPVFERLWRAHWMRGVVLGAVSGPFARSGRAREGAAREPQAHPRPAARADQADGASHANIRS